MCISVASFTSFCLFFGSGFRENKLLSAPQNTVNPIIEKKRVVSCGMCEVDTTKLLEELRKVKENLSEVIDECIFLENQCEMTEKRLKSELLDRDKRIADISSALMEMVKYTSLLERQVIASAFTTLGSAMKRAPAIDMCRNISLREVASAVRERGESSGSRSSAKRKTRNGALYSEAKMAEEKNAFLLSVDEACALVNGLLREKVNLAAKIGEVAFHVNNAIARGERTSPALPDASSENVDDLHQSILNLTKQLSACGNEGDEEKNLKQVPSQHTAETEEPRQPQGLIAEKEDNTSRPQSPSQTQPPAGLASLGPHILDISRSSLPAVSITTQKGEGECGDITTESLVKKLAAAEEKCMAVEKQSRREREELHAELAYLRNSSREEKEEYNTLIERLTVELEILVAENAVMRKRIKGRKHSRDKIE
ncbi:hypothetical protein, conserved [Trypanosoma brucei brucei TREU927]|uniref:Uncharacterized protein n=2 Tax=Trypanozoon TaxID=39700 RepID=Q38E76_TRYB2|nr:hypothetical protein, conserved [Trypanosoma brucei brucei TREU927]EAN76894.1 hypothetical protein, conserved [Trypanosoma brucei brucei TREU927]